jgi:hypothetical protein
MLYVITQRTDNFDRNKGLIPKCIKVTSTWHPSSQSSQELQSFLLRIFLRKNNSYGPFSAVRLHINLKTPTSLDQDKSSRLMCNSLCKWNAQFHYRLHTTKDLRLQSLWIKTVTHTRPYSMKFKDPLHAYIHNHNKHVKRSYAIRSNNLISE